MKINEVCRMTGLTERTVRFYIEKGLLETYTIIRNGRATREFTEKDIENLIAVSKLRSAGFTIQDIGEMQQSEENVHIIVSKQREKIEQENLNRDIILLELKKAEKRGRISWRKLASILNLNGQKNENDILCYPIEEFDEIKNNKNRGNIRNIRNIIVVALLLVFGTFGCWQGIKMNKITSMTFLLGDVIVEDKWQDNDGKKYVSIYTKNQYEGKGVERFFEEPKAVRIVSEDYYNSLHVKSTSYQSFNIWIEIPYGDAINQELLDEQGNIILNNVLAKEEYIKKYCTVRIIYND